VVGSLLLYRKKGKKRYSFIIILTDSPRRRKKKRKKVSLYLKGGGRRGGGEGDLPSSLPWREKGSETESEKQGRKERGGEGRISTHQPRRERGGRKKRKYFRLLFSEGMPGGKEITLHPERERKPFLAMVGFGEKEEKASEKGERGGTGVSFGENKHPKRKGKGFPKENRPTSGTPRA